MSFHLLLFVFEVMGLFQLILLFWLKCRRIFLLDLSIIFGHVQNINLLKSRNYLRAGQFGIWEEDDFVEDAFVKPDIVLSNILRIL